MPEKNLFKENVSLADYSTFKIGGPARFFAEVANQEELKKAWEWAEDKALPIFVLGGGSNLLFMENGWPGLVIKIKFDDLSIPDSPYILGQKYQVKVGAGLLVRILASEVTERGLRGLEWAGSLPGTIGGAVRGNAGAFRFETKQNVKTVSAFHQGQIKTLTNAECVFGYRTSLFKTILNNAVIISVELELEAGDLKESQEQLVGFLKHRQKSQPLFPSAGCIFKNYFFNDPAKIDLRLQPLMTEQFWEYKKIPAAWLVENAGLKGAKIGGAQVSSQHSNFIVNVGGATAKDVLQLIQKIKETVLQKFDVNLEEEIQIVETKI